MLRVRWCLAAAVLVALTAWGVAVYAENEAESGAGGPPADERAPAEEPDQADEDWLNTVWTQVDEMVQREEYELQETVTVAAVRGAEAEDAILDKLYYRGGKRYPSQEKLRQAIETLKKAIAADPKSAEVPRQRFFIAQCHEKLGQVAEARSHYEQVTRDHADTRWAEKSRERLAALAPAE